jgi:DNA-directed RNA polymerase specialized sigma24 family protein
MSGWKIITKSLYAKGGGPLPRKAFDEDFRSDYAASAALDESRKRGLVSLARRAYFYEWALTLNGIDWCEGRLVIGSAPAAPAETVSEHDIRVARLVADSDEAAEACRRLTDGQRAVLVLVAKGYTRNEICDRLRVGPDAVERRITRALKTIGCDRSIEAAVIAAKAGLV